VRKVAVAALAGIVAAFVASPAARADERIIAAPLSSGYVNPDVAIEPGEKVTFFNPDVAPHDVVSKEPGLFASETVGTGAEVPVTGADALSAGSYPFICSVHPYMEGTLTVSAGGSGGGGGHGGHDMKAPKVSVKVLDRRISDVLDAGALGIQVKLNEPATVRPVAAVDGTKVAKGRARLGSGSTRMAMKLTAKGKRLLRNARQVELELTLIAADGAGNAAKRSATAKLR
jgi:plastocyanin